MSTDERRKPSGRTKPKTKPKTKSAVEPTVKRPAAGQRRADLTVPGKAAVELPPPKLTEIAILKSRENSREGNAIQIRSDVNALRGVISKNAGREGEDAHEIGTEVAVLYQKMAERVYGYPLFVDFARAELRLTRSTLYRYVGVAKYATATQSRWGIETCLAGGRLVELLRARVDLRRRFQLKEELRTISDLAGVAFPLPDGRTVQLKGQALALEDVAVLASLVAPGGGANGKRLPRELRVANEALGAAVRSDPSLVGVEAGYVQRKGRRVFELKAPASADLEAVALAVVEIVGRKRS